MIVGLAALLTVLALICALFGWERRPPLVGSVILLCIVELLRLWPGK